MIVQQAISNPFGITVFGSAIIRIVPDIASLTFGVARIGQHPRDAFRDAQDAAKKVRLFLADSKFGEMGTSRTVFSPEYKFANGEQHFIGYCGRIRFNVLLHDLDRIEPLLIGAVDAGANEVGSTDFQTSRLKEVRFEARRRAINAAREKADSYCAAAGIKLGPIVHIEDVNPDTFFSAPSMHVTREPQPDDFGAQEAFDPGSITVAAAVVIAYHFGL
jgi:uncharacterized protein YggE